MVIYEKTLEIRLPFEQFDALEHLANGLNISVSELIQQQITQLLEKEGYLTDTTTLSTVNQVTLAETRQNYVVGPPKIQISTPIEEDPLMDIIALGASGLGDLAVKHDYYLSEIEQNDNSL